MQENLVIVESPAKAKTIEKFLGKDYKVMSSYGHIRDLKKKELSVDTKTLEPDYEIPEEKMKLVSELKKNAKKSRKIWLASDEDREGEAIRGICAKSSGWMKRIQTALCSTKLPNRPFLKPYRTPVV